MQLGCRENIQHTGDPTIHNILSIVCVFCSYRYVGAFARMFGFDIRTICTYIENMQIMMSGKRPLLYNITPKCYNSLGGVGGREKSRTCFHKDYHSPQDRHTRRQADSSQSNVVEQSCCDPPCAVKCIAFFIMQFQIF